MIFIRSASAWKKPHWLAITTCFRLGLLKINYCSLVLMLKNCIKLLIINDFALLLNDLALILNDLALLWYFYYYLNSMHY